MALGLVACTSTQDTGGSSDAGAAPDTVAVDPDVKPTPSADNLMIEFDPYEGTPADASLDFGMELLSVVRDQADDPDETILLSPVSISTAFGLLYIGSAGQTQADIASVMRFGAETDAFAASLGDLGRAVERDTTQPYTDARTIIDINNTMFLDRSLVITPGYAERIDRAFGAGVQSADFLNDPRAAEVQINRWVSNATRGLIPKLYNPKDLSEDTSDVLINTIYMKANWASELGQDDGPFTTPNAQKTVPRVGGLGRYPYVEGRGYTALMVPFADRELAAVAILPDRDLDQLETTLDADAIAAMLDAMSAQGYSDYTRVDFALPKMSISGSFKLREPLEAMGMVTPFDRNRADFRGRIDPRLQSRRVDNIAASNVTHKTVLDLDEIGVEAAAVTAIDSVVVTSARPPEPDPIPFIVDRPFYLMLVHTPTGAPLFLARVTDPGDVSD